MKTKSIRTPWANDGIIKNSGSHPAPYGTYEPAPLVNGVVSPNTTIIQTILDIVSSPEFEEFFDSDFRDYLDGLESDFSSEEEITKSLQRLFKPIIGVAG